VITILSSTFVESFKKINLLKMIIKSNLNVIIFRCLLTILILICLYNFKINPNFFGFIIVILLVLIIISTNDIVRITDTTVEFENKRLIPFMTETRIINFIDIKSIEYLKGDSSILLLIFSFLLGLGITYKQVDKIIITLKDDVIVERKVFRKKGKIKEAIKIIQDKINKKELKVRSLKNKE